MDVLEFVYVLLIPASIFLISEGADWMTDGAAVLSRKWKITRTALGTVFVSIFTGLPELIICMLAIRHGEDDIILGNILGANIASIALLVGICSLIGHLRTPRRIILRDGIFLLAATLAACLTMLDGRITGTEGLILIAMYVPYMINVYEMERVERKYEREGEARVLEVELELIGKLVGKKIKTRRPFIAFLFGILLLVGSGELFLRGAIQLALLTGIPQIFIGLTVVAIGTTLPDAVAAVKATLKGYDDLAVSEAVGANLFGVMIIPGAVALIAPDGIESAGSRILFISIGALLIITAGLLIAMMRGRRIDRKEGLILIGIYIGYLLLAAWFL